MIANFSVSNYRSIKNLQSISFVATSDKTNRELDTQEVAKGIFINKLAIFLGPNASGKSNILLALQAVISLMSKPCGSKRDVIPNYIPFGMIDERPCTMSLDFFIEGIRYFYDLEFNRKEIMKESLYYVPSRSKALIYAREFVGEDKQPKISYGTTTRLFLSTKDALREHTYNNSTVLSTVSKLSLRDDADILKKILSWAETRVILIDNGLPNSGYASELQKIDTDKDKRDLLIKLLRKADFNITDFRIVKEESQEGGNINVLFTNRSDEGAFDTPLELQSEGTLRFIELSDILYNVSKENYVYLVDELGNKLHYELIVYYLRLFLFGSESSQIFFTTQSLLLLDEDFIRYDTVYLTEKEPVSASTIYERVSDLKLRKGGSLYKWYRIGKLGSIPEVGSPYVQ